MHIFRQRLHLVTLAYLFIREETVARGDVGAGDISRVPDSNVVRPS